MRYPRAAQSYKLDGIDAVRSFFAGCFAESDLARECLWVAHVDREGNCVHLSRHVGDSCGTKLPIRTIIGDAAVHEGTGLILAHNHPSGDPTPSVADCYATRRLAAVAEALECAVVDHLIFGGSDICSFRRLGLL
jgi:DNA repair protein RadC